MSNSKEENVMGRKILLADDSITIQKVVNLTFSDEGIDVISVGNGELAVRKLADTKPDLVLVDIFMPGRSGYEVCEYIKNNPQFSHIPVLLLVGAFEPFDQTEANRVKADGHLTKPFESRALVATVNKLLAQLPPAPVTAPAPVATPPPVATPVSTAPSLTPASLPTAQPVEFMGESSGAPVAPLSFSPPSSTLLPTAQPASSPPVNDWAFSNPTIPLGSLATTPSDVISGGNAGVNAVSFLPPGEPPSPLPAPINPLNTENTNSFAAVDVPSEPPQFDLGFDFTKPVAMPITPTFELPSTTVSPAPVTTIPISETPTSATPNFALDQFEEAEHTQLMGSPTAAPPTNLANDIWVLDTDNTPPAATKPDVSDPLAVIKPATTSFEDQFAEDLRDTSTYASPVQVSEGPIPTTTQENVAAGFDPIASNVVVDNNDNYEEMPLDLEPLEEYTTGSQEALLEISDPLSLEEISTISSEELHASNLASGELTAITSDESPTGVSETDSTRLLGVTNFNSESAIDNAEISTTNEKIATSQRDTGEITMSRQTMDMLEAMPDTSLEEAIAAESVAKEVLEPVTPDQSAKDTTIAPIVSNEKLATEQISAAAVFTASELPASESAFAALNEKNLLPETTAEIEIVSPQDIPISTVRGGSGPLELDLGEPLPAITNVSVPQSPISAEEEEVSAASNVISTPSIVVPPASSVNLDVVPDLLATQQVEVMPSSAPVATTPNLSLENVVVNSTPSLETDAKIIEFPNTKPTENNVPTLILPALTSADIDAAQTTKATIVNRPLALVDENTRKTIEITTLPVIPLAPSIPAAATPLPSGELDITALDSETSSGIDNLDSKKAIVNNKLEISQGAITSIEQIPQALVDEIVRRTIAQMSDAVVREIAWEIVPELAEIMIKKRMTQTSK
jgi:CheY-like chemotaxis protein